MELIRSSLQPENYIELSFLWFGHNEKLSFELSLKCTNVFTGRGLSPV